MFSANTLDFLFENRLQDSRPWFEEHKEDYRKLVLEPLRVLVQELAPAMLKIDDKFVTEAKVDRTISRIWRDTRYSKDKSLYRENMWIIFKRGKMHGTEVPGFYFDISGQGFAYGCGFYNASAAYMEKFRELALSSDRTFIKAKKAYDSQKIYQMDGELYKRSRFPDQPEQMRQWLDRRGISFNAKSKDFDLLFSQKLGEKLIADFKLLSPVYDFLLRVSQENLMNP